MKILITGGEGFLGKSLRKVLNKKGIISKSLDIKGKPDFLLSVVDGINIKEEFSAVVHLAAQTNVVWSAKNPKKDAEINILGTIEVLEFCRKTDVEQIIFSSTSAVYGEQEKVNEESKKMPLSPYGCSKSAAEEYIQLYERVYGIKGTILRYANIYGPGEEEKEYCGVVTKFIKNAINKERCKIFGNGMQSRDFLFVEDAVEAILLALEKKKGGIYNVGSGKNSTIVELFNIIKKNAEKRGIEVKEPIYEKERKEEIKSVGLDVSKIRKEMGWSAKTTLEEGVEKTFEYNILKSKNK